MMVHSDATWFPFECKQNALDWDFKIDSQIPPAPFFLSPQFITCSMIAISHVWLWTELEVNTHWFPRADTLKQRGDKTTPADLQSKGEAKWFNICKQKTKVTVVLITFLPSSGSENFQKHQSALVAVQLITIYFSVSSEFLRRLSGNQNTLTK